MARTKGGINRSAEVRSLLQANPDMPASEVVSTLGSKGIKVAPSLIYFVKGTMKAKKQRKTRVVRAARVASSNGRAIGNGDAISLIREVKALAEKAGGYDNLKGLVEALAE